MRLLRVGIHSHRQSGQSHDKVWAHSLPEVRRDLKANDRTSAVPLSPMWVAVVDAI